MNFCSFSSSYLIGLLIVRNCSFVLVFLALLTLRSTSYCQNSKRDTSFHPVLNPSLAVSRRVGTITIDGNLNDAGWTHAARTKVFTGCVPHPMTPPPVETEALVTYDDDYLYVAMIGHDPHPENIRQSMIGRDNIWQDDFMGIILDPYGDGVRAFEVYLNPRGIQGDLFWSATNEDMSYDLIYSGESKITSDGWQIEMRIPFRSLRFPNVAVQNFHIAFWRSYPRDVVYKMSSSPIDFRIPCIFCQLGPLTGIENIPHTSSVELLPSLAATQAAARTGQASLLSNEPIRLKPSLGIRYGMGPASSIEATANPDFSQVESDAAQVSVNTTFALFYPEHRPFFQDGSDLFTTPLAAVYTRSIDDPLGAIKLLHRGPTWSLGYLGGYDRHSPVIIPLEERSVVIPDAGKSYSNILRVAKTIGTDSYVGALLTDRRYADKGSNTVAGIDGRVRLFENVALSGQGLWSGTIESNTHSIGDTTLFNDARHTVEYDGERLGGTSASLQIERITESIDAHIVYSETSPAFRAGNGFYFNNDIQSATGWARYKIPMVNQNAWLGWLVEVDPSVTAQYNWNFDDVTKLRELRPLIHVDFIGQSSLWYYHRFYSQEFGGILFPGLTQWDIGGNTTFASGVSLYAEITVGQSIATTAPVPFAGKGVDVSASATLKPIGSLLIEPSYRFSQLAHDNGAIFYAGSIYRSRFTYQFTRELDARVIVQYNGFADQLDIDPLITYKVNPFTSFYIGSTHNFVSTVGSINSLQPTERQFFAKVQYLIAE